MIGPVSPCESFAASLTATEARPA